MTPRPGPFARRWRTLVAAAALSPLLMAAETAWPQTAPPPSPGAQEQQPAAPPQQPAPVAPAPQAAPENPGLIHEMGKLIDKVLPAKTPTQPLDDLNAQAKDAAKDAGDAFSRLATPSTMVSGRSICPPGADGTPDCKAAADRLCQGKGRKEGKSLNTDSAETCSAKVLIPGRTRKPGDCRTDTYVTAALCQ